MYLQINCINSEHRLGSVESEAFRQCMNPGSRLTFWPPFSWKAAGLQKILPSCLFPGFPFANFNGQQLARQFSMWGHDNWSRIMSCCSNGNAAHWTSILCNTWCNKLVVKMSLILRLQMRKVRRQWNLQLLKVWERNVEQHSSVHKIFPGSRALFSPSRLFLITCLDGYGRDELSCFMLGAEHCTMYRVLLMQTFSMLRIIEMTLVIVFIRLDPCLTK